MVVENACAWIEERIRNRRPCFAVRINDGEMMQMYRTRPEGELLGTSENPAPCRWDLGTALREIVYGMCGRDDCLIGCSRGTERADKLCELFDLDLAAQPIIESYNWAHEHWPLEGACDGSMRRLIEAAQEAGPACLVTSEKLAAAGKLFDRVFLIPGEDSWAARHEVHHSLALLAARDMTFFWAAGAGLKPTAWRLWREFPRTTHVDVGHVFNGALGLRDYGWLQRKDGWWDRYFAPGGFAEWVRKECGL